MIWLFGDDIVFCHSAWLMQMRMNLKVSGEISLKTPPSLDVGRGYPMKEILLKEAPAKLLLASGLLDGHQVRYLGRGGHVHSFKPSAVELLVDCSCMSRSAVSTRKLKGGLSSFSLLHLFEEFNVER
jgi:hypothetical protein